MPYYKGIVKHGKVIMLADDKEKKQQKAVWFNEEQVAAYETLNLVQPFNEFVKQAFYEKLNELKKEVVF